MSRSNIWEWECWFVLETLPEMPSQNFCSIFCLKQTVTDCGVVWCSFPIKCFCFLCSIQTNRLSDTLELNDFLARLFLICDEDQESASSSPIDTTYSDRRRLRFCYIQCPKISLKGIKNSFECRCFHWAYNLSDNVQRSMTIMPPHSVCHVVQQQVLYRCRESDCMKIHKRQNFSINFDTIKFDLIFFCILLVNKRLHTALLLVPYDKDYM